MLFTATRPLPLLQPASDRAYSAATVAVTALLTYTAPAAPNAHVLAGTAVEAAAPYVQHDVLRRLIATTTWRSTMHSLLVMLTSAAGLGLAIAYAWLHHVWWLGSIEAFLLAALCWGMRVLTAAAAAESSAARALLGNR